MKFRRILDVFHFERFAKNALGAFLRFMLKRLKTKLFDVKFRRIRRFRPARFTWKASRRISRFVRAQTKLVAVMCRRLFDTLLWKVYKKRFGCILTIYATENEAVCCDKQTHFGCFSLARFAKKPGRFFGFMRPKTELAVCSALADQLCLPQKCLQGPPYVIYKNIFDVMDISRPNGLCIKKSKFLFFLISLF